MHNVCKDKATKKKDLKGRENSRVKGDDSVTKDNVNANEVVNVTENVEQNCEATEMKKGISAEGLAHGTGDDGAEGSGALKE